MNKEVITQCCQNAVKNRVVRIGELKEYINAMTDEEVKELESRLSAREKEALESDNLAEFGRKYDISRERARQLKETARMKIAVRVASAVIAISEEPKPDYREVDKEIKGKKIRNYQLAERVGLSAPTLAGMRKGEIPMKPIDAYAIRKAL